jgi:hypothetical protein
MTQEIEWDRTLHNRIAQLIRTARGSRSAQWLADETERLGYPISRSQIANYESGRKQGLDVAELMVLAAALGLPPVALLFGGHPDDLVEVLPAQKGTSVAALAWFTGDRELAWPGPEFEPEEARKQADAVIADPKASAVALLNLYRDRAARHREIAIARASLKLIDKDADEFGRAVDHVGKLAEQIDAINFIIEAFISEENKK